MMTNLAIALMLGMQSVLPDVSQNRIRAMSEDMVFVVNNEFSEGSLRSKLVREEALVMLVAVSIGESSLRYDIENCKVTGDRGKSVGLGQVMSGPNWKSYTRSEICSNRKIQFKLSLYVLDACWQRSSDETATFRCYTSGDTNKSSYIARYEYFIYKKIKTYVTARVAGQNIRTCNLTSLSTFYIREANTCEL